MNSKKSFTMAEALVRIIIAVVLLFIVFKFGKGIANSFFGGNDALQSFEGLANEMNSKENWVAKPTLLSLDTDTAVIGFSKSGDFQCYGCDGSSKDKLVSTFKRPTSLECTNTACICLCTKELKVDFGKNPKSIECAKIYCRRIENYDIQPFYQLKSGKLKTLGDRSDFASWHNGFIFARDIPDGDSGDPEAKDIGKHSLSDATATGYISNEQRTISVQLERKTTNGVSYAMVCPESPCIQ